MDRRWPAAGMRPRPDAAPSSKAARRTFKSRPDGLDRLFRWRLPGFQGGPRLSHATRRDGLAQAGKTLGSRPCSRRAPLTSWRYVLPFAESARYAAQCPQHGARWSADTLRAQHPMECSGLSATELLRGPLDASRETSDIRPGSSFRRTGSRKEPGIARLHGADKVLMHARIECGWASASVLAVSGGPPLHQFPAGGLLARHRAVDPVRDTRSRPRSEK